MAIQIKKYNSEYKCKDPTKKPCVLLLNMENDVAETVERMFSMMTQRRLEDFASEDEALEMFRTRGLELKDESPIDLVIKYRPGLTEDTSYIYKLIDDLADEGYEVICVLVDYLKRIKSVQGSFGGDLRMELGAIVNELKILATLKQIPVITASQLNRTATANIDNARTKNKQDLVRLLGRAHVAESNLILENSDWIALIAPEIAQDGSRYLGIQRVKQRYYIPDGFNCVYMPYLGKTIKLVEDTMLPNPLHKSTMSNSDDPVLLKYGMSSNVIGAPKMPMVVEDDEMESMVDSMFQNPVRFVTMRTFPPIVRKQLYELVKKPTRTLYELVKKPTRTLYELVRK